MTVDLGMDRRITLDDFCRDVMWPTVTRMVRRGNCDSVIFDPELDEFYADNSEMMALINERRAALGH